MCVNASFSFSLFFTFVCIRVLISITATSHRHCVYFSILPLSHSHSVSNATFVYNGFAYTQLANNICAISHIFIYLFIGYNSYIVYNITFTYVRLLLSITVVYVAFFCGVYVFVAVWFKLCRSVSCYILGFLRLLRQLNLISRTINVNLQQTCHVHTTLPTWGKGSSQLKRSTFFVRVIAVAVCFYTFITFLFYLQFFFCRKTWFLSSS